MSGCSSRLAYRRRPPHQLRQLGEVRGHPTGLVLGKQALRFIVEIGAAERLGSQARAWWGLSWAAVVDLFPPRGTVC